MPLQKSRSDVPRMLTPVDRAPYPLSHSGAGASRPRPGPCRHSMDRRRWSALDPYAPPARPFGFPGESGWRAVNNRRLDDQRARLATQILPL